MSPSSIESSSRLSSSTMVRSTFLLTRSKLSLAIRASGALSDGLDAIAQSSFSRWRAHTQRCLPNAQAGFESPRVGENAAQIIYQSVHVAIRLLASRNAPRTRHD